MKKIEIKEVIDRELRQIELKDDIKNNIRNGVTALRPDRIWKNIAASAAAFAAVIILGGTTVFAGYYMLNRVWVNEEVLPELDSMQIVQMNEPETAPDEYGMIYEGYADYAAMQEALGLEMLDTRLSDDNPYMLCRLKTDAKDFAIITVDNYITGDTGNYQYMEEENRYAFDNGKEYYTPVSLTADLVLSESQLDNGWDTDYLGMYRFAENYTSEQGYKVNIIEDTIEEELEDYVSEKAAVFVAGGIRYTLKGRVSIDTMKDIVDTMR